MYALFKGYETHIGLNVRLSSSQLHVRETLRLYPCLLLSGYRPNMNHTIGLDIDQQLRAVRQPSLNIYALPTAKSKMADVPPLYTHPTLPPAVLERLQKPQEHYNYKTEVYTGSCHCQAVTYGVVAKPIEEEEVCVCTCSICQGVRQSDIVLVFTYDGKAGSSVGRAVER